MSKLVKLDRCDKNLRSYRVPIYQKTSFFVNQDMDSLPVDTVKYREYKFDHRFEGDLPVFEEVLEQRVPAPVKQKRSVEILEEVFSVGP